MARNECSEDTRNYQKGAKKKRDSIRFRLKGSPMTKGSLASGEKRLCYEFMAQRYRANPYLSPP